MLKYITISLILLALPAPAAVTIAKYYDDAKMAFSVRSDDLVNQAGYVGFDDHLTASASFYEPLNIPLEIGVVANSLNATGYSEFGAHMATNDMNPIGVHSWIHSWAAETNYTAEYTWSKDKIESDMSLPWQYKYNGNQYVTVFNLSGTATNLTHNGMVSALTNAEYLGISSGRPPGAETNWYDYITYQSGAVDPASWDSGLGIFEPLGYSWSCSQISSTNGATWFDTVTNNFMEAWTNEQYFSVIGHQYGTSFTNDNVMLDTNTYPRIAVLRQFFEYAGDRRDVWYTGCEHFAQYLYLRTVNTPTISIISTNDIEVVFSVTGDSAARAKYGCSWPITFKVDKPSGWAASNGYTVEYKDTGTWQAVTKKTTNDFYHAENCYRDTASQVIVNQALPQLSDSFQIRIRRRRMMPAFFTGAGP